jgi:GDP-4-dehydro-6-deoxy-D-mannose reductase
MRAVITGQQGFVGQYLMKQLREDGVATYGFDMRHKQDIRHYEGVRNYLDRVRPDYIYHLAAQAFVPESFHNPRRTFEVNTIGSLNILDAVRQLGLKTKILLVGTSEEYGDGDVNESALPQPLSPYAISKLAMDYLGQLYAKSYNMQVVVTRAFNHTGAGRGEMYAESAFAKQIVQIERGLRDRVEHGNLESIRNYTDVRDMVKAYQKAVELPSGVYNICSDQNVTMEDVLQVLISKSTAENIQLAVNKDLFRPADFSFLPPNCDKLKKLSGWKAEIPLHQTLEDILEYWREKL